MLPPLGAHVAVPRAPGYLCCPSATIGPPPRDGMSDDTPIRPRLEFAADAGRADARPAEHGEGERVPRRSVARRDPRHRPGRSDVWIRAGLLLQGGTAGAAEHPPCD